jgi:DUF971 family protein
MKIELTQLESEEIFFTALCNLYSLAGHGLLLDWNETEYEAAKSRLRHANPKIRVSSEEIVMEMLHGGGEIRIIDEEGDGEYSCAITLKEIHERVGMVPTDRLLEIINETDDADTADIVFQTVFFKEVIFR